jgi:hypothetical protein
MKSCQWPLRITDLWKSLIYDRSPYSNLIHLVFQSFVQELEDSIPEPPLPPMRMDVLGLKHDEVMNKVCKHMLLKWRN